MIVVFLYSVKLDKCIHIIIFLLKIFIWCYIFMKPNQEAPCKERWCSFCCDPAWIVWRYSPDVSKITDTTWKQIWKYIWMRPSKKNPDTQKIWLYECLLFDKTMGKCKAYEQRPDICRNTSCINSESDKSIDDQYEEFTNI